MKIAIFSDIHIHNHRFGGVINEETGRQSRLQHGLDTLEWTRKAAEVAGCDFRLFAGDLFHVRGKLAPSVLNPVIEHFSKDSDVCDIGIVGNHDMENRATGEHSLMPFGEIKNAMYVLEDHGVGVFPSNGQSIIVGWVAYDPDIPVLKSKVQAVAAQVRNDFAELQFPKIFLLHHGVDGSMPNIPDMGFAPVDLPHDDFDWCFCGDYHTHKELIPGKAWMVGAPMQHTFGDTGQRRGMMILDTEARTAELIENNIVPKFLAFENGTSYITKAVAGQFVRVRSNDEKELDKMEEKALSNGAIAVQKEYIRDWAQIERSDVSLNMTTGQMFNTWIDGQEVGDLDKSRIKVLNAEILQEAGVS